MSSIDQAITAGQKISKLEARIEQAERLLRDHECPERCAADCCGCMGCGLEELVENLKDDHTKATSELRRLKAAVKNARLDIAYLPDGGIVLLPEGQVTP